VSECEEEVWARRDGERETHLEAALGDGADDVGLQGLVQLGEERERDEWVDCEGEGVSGGSQVGGGGEEGEGGRTVARDGCDVAQAVALDVAHCDAGRPRAPRAVGAASRVGPWLVVVVVVLLVRVVVVVRRVGSRLRCGYPYDRVRSLYGSVDGECGREGRGEVGREDAASANGERG